MHSLTNIPLFNFKRHTPKQTSPFSNSKDTRPNKISPFFSNSKDAQPKVSSSPGFNRQHDLTAKQVTDTLPAVSHLSSTPWPLLAQSK